MANSIIRLDHAPDLIRTAVAYGAIQNGAPLILTALTSGEREKWTSAAATATTSKEDIWVVATVEMDYDETPKKKLEDFTNASGDTIRVVKWEAGKMFSITGDAISGTPSTTDCYLIPAAAGWTADDVATYGFAKYRATETFEGKTVYVYEVL